MGYSTRATSLLEKKRSIALKGGGDKRIEKQHQSVSLQPGSSEGNTYLILFSFPHIYIYIYIYIFFFFFFFFFFFYFFPPCRGNSLLGSVLTCSWTGGPLESMTCLWSMLALILEWMRL